MHRLRTTRLGLLLGVLVPLAIWAGDLALPHTFQAGGPIRASEMNENFEAVRAAVNGKADANAVITSGTRLRRLGFRMSDGTTEPALWTIGTGTSVNVYFDTQDNRHCFVLPAWTDSAGRSRCFPLFVGSEETSPRFLDAQCTTRAPRLAYRTAMPTIAGQSTVPNDNTLIVVGSPVGGGGSLRYYEFGARFTGSLFSTQCSPSAPCCAVPATQEVFEFGPEFSLSAAVEVTPTRF